MFNRLQTKLSAFIMASIFAVSLSAEVTLTQAEIDEIHSKIDAMSVSELRTHREFLLNERKELLAADEITQLPSKKVEIQTSLGKNQIGINRTNLLLGLLVVGAASSSGGSSSQDTEAPVIVIKGDNPATVELGSSYTDEGAVALDGTTVTSSGTVDTSTLGVYKITYTATDLAGNTSTKTRTVNVVDTTAPVVTLTGSASVTVELGGTYTELGATATDASGAVSVSIELETVDTSTVGSYTVNYTSTDGSGNIGTILHSWTNAEYLASAWAFDCIESLLG